MIHPITSGGKVLWILKVFSPYLSQCRHWLSGKVSPKCVPKPHQYCPTCTLGLLSSIFLLQLQLHHICSSEGCWEKAHCGHQPVRSPESLSRVQGLLSQLPVLGVPQPCSQPHLSSGLLKQPCLYSKSHKVFLTNSLSSSLQTSPHREPQISPRDLEERFHSALSSLLPTPPQPIKPTKCPHGFKTGTLTLRNGNKQPLAYKHMWGGEGGQCGWVGGKVLCRWGEGVWCVCMYRQYWYFSTEVDFSVLALNDQPVYRHLQMC